MPYKAVGLEEQFAFDFGMHKNATTSLVSYYPMPLQYCHLAGRFAELGKGSRCTPHSDQNSRDLVTHSTLSLVPVCLRFFFHSSSLTKACCGNGHCLEDIDLEMPLA